MNVVFGFGQSHIDKTKRFANDLASALIADAQTDPREVATRMAESVGVFKETDWKIVHIRRVEKYSGQQADGDETIVVDGTYAHIRDDHPMSPDGFAQWTVPFCVTILQDDAWGERVFVSV